MTKSQQYIEDIKILVKKGLSTKEIIDAMEGHPNEPQINNFKIKMIKIIIKNNR